MIEIYGATKPQRGRTANEDAFIIGKEPVHFACLCDGAGNAEGAAKKIINFLQRLITSTSQEELEDYNTWLGWIKVFDSCLMGSNESTFIGYAIFEKLIVGAFVGDSRGYLIKANGETQLVTKNASKARLGSGRATGEPIFFPIQDGDVFLLLSDGVWTPFETPIKMGILVNSKAILQKYFIPEAIIQAAENTGHLDDMTVVALFR